MSDRPTPMTTDGERPKVRVSPDITGTELDDKKNEIRNKYGSFVLVQERLQIPGDPSSGWIKTWEDVD